ncbi:GDP-mannose transporter into the lumen of the Golgi [Entomortierella chlamydospora]|nr:GDP-mannose transporter into the lumen of the Golgi [Entomortierella chlamydospora]
MTVGTSQNSIANSATVSILAYCSSSILMTVTNKMVLSRFDFHMNFFLLTIQALTAVIFLWVFKKLKLITYRQLDTGEAKKWFPISLGLVAMIYTGTYGEVLWFGSRVTPLMLLSFTFMVLSSVIAGWSDIRSFVLKDPSDLVELNIGYGWMALNCLSSAGYVLYMRRRIKHFNFQDFDTVYYNNLLSLPVMLVLSFCLEGWTSGEFERTFAWCVRCTSSTTYSMVGALNKLPVAASGILFFGDPATLGNIFGIFFGFIAGLLYSYSKTEQAQKNFALANGSPLSTTSSSGAELAQLRTPAVPPSKATGLPLYNSNPDGKIAD